MHSLEFYENNQFYSNEIKLKYSTIHQESHLNSTMSNSKEILITIVKEYFMLFPLM